MPRFRPVLYLGFILWTLGAGLKILFSRNTSPGVYVVVLLIEGAGVGFVFQPCKSCSNPTIPHNHLSSQAAY